MALTTPDAPGWQDPDVLDPGQFAALAGFRRAQTVTDLCAAGQVPGARKVGAGEAGDSRAWGRWRIHLPTFYAAVAGPGVPFGEILSSDQLAARLGLPERTVRRALGNGRWPGLRVGKVWLCAVPAIWAQFGWALDTTAGPEGHAPGAAGERPDRVRPSGAGQAPDLVAAEMPLPPGVRGPRARRAGGQRAARRPAAPGGPGRSAAAR